MKPTSIYELQRQAAASTDELLAISGDIGKYVIETYGKIPQAMSDMQCRAQLGRCMGLKNKLLKLQKEIEKTKGSKADLAVTAQLIAQNIAILLQKEELLEGLLAHSGAVQESLGAAGEMELQAEAVKLKKMLEKETGKSMGQ